MRTASLRFVRFVDLIRLGSTPIAVTLAIATILGAAPAAAQDLARATALRATPATLSLQVGQTAQVTVTAVGPDGESIETADPVTLVGPRGDLAVQDGTVMAYSPGEFELIATLAREDAEPLQLRIPVTVTWPPVSSIEIEVQDPELATYAGSTRYLTATALHADGTPRPDTEMEWGVGSPDGPLRVSGLGVLRAVAPGTGVLTARMEGVTASTRIDVLPLPPGEIVLSGETDALRTGDVVIFEASYRPTGGTAITDAPIAWTVSRVREDFEQRGAPAGAQIRDGKFVADVPGTYQVMAALGDHTADMVFAVAPRDVVEELEVTGHALTSTYRTTDLWVFEGLDGRDYAMTGSKVADGHAFFFDVTDPANIVKYDSIQVNGRTVNDVKISPDGRYGVISREGASDRRNGIVIVDLADPLNPEIASIYDEGLTGGVHNVFATNDYLFALSGGDKYVILDVRDIYNPAYVSEYDHPDSGIHDVWVHDGLAYSAEWGSGVVVVDVGDGRWGGSIENPVLVTTYQLPTGRTHAVVPYYSESADRMYIFTGDEIMSRGGLAWAGYPRSMGSYSSRYDPETGTGGIPLTTRGYIQIIDFDDPANPQMVARYEVPEYGTHNFWIEDDRLYQAYYEGGVRVVDVSGELMGNLYDQGREIAVFKSAHPEGYTPNATMVWGAQPHKGHVFFSDTNSGLWSIRLIPRTRPVM